MDISEALKQGKPFHNVYHKTSVNLIFSGKWMFNIHSEYFKKFGLTVQQYNALRILRGQFPKTATVKLIRERMIDKMSDASRIVENLRKKGLISRELNPNSRREVDVIITRNGLELLLSIEEKGNTILESHMTNLSKEEHEQLNFLLDKVRG